MNKYDVYWARYAFEDNPTNFKVRPVVILDPTSILILVIKVTSKPPRKNYNDYELVDWSAAGLKVKSTVRLDKQLKINSSDILNYIGHLSNKDILAIEQILKNVK